MTQETQRGALCQPRGVGWGGRWDGGSKGKGCIYTYGCFDRKQQNSVQQLSFNKNLIKKTETLLCCLVKVMVFPVVTYGCESWTIKKAEH